MRAAGPLVSPIPTARRRIRFLGLQQIPDPADEEIRVDVTSVDPLPGSQPLPDPGPAQQEESVGREKDAPKAVSDTQRKDTLRPRLPRSYRDNRAWTRRKLLAGYLGATSPGDLLISGRALGATATGGVSHGRP